MAEKTSVWLLIVGGILPAILFGLDAVCSKLSVRAGNGAAMLTLLSGIGMTVVGAILALLFREELPQSLLSAAPGLAKGLAAGIGIGLVGYAISKGAPLSKIVPLYNANGLVAVAISIVFLAEGAAMDTKKLLVGTVLIIAGATLVSAA